MDNSSRSRSTSSSSANQSFVANNLLFRNHSARSHRPSANSSRRHRSYRSPTSSKRRRRMKILLSGTPHLLNRHTALHPQSDRISSPHYTILIALPITMTLHDTQHININSPQHSRYNTAINSLKRFLLTKQLRPRLSHIRHINLKISPTRLRQPPKANVLHNTVTTNRNNTTNIITNNTIARHSHHQRRHRILTSTTTLKQNGS